MHYLRDDATRWVWIIYGLTQATVTMLMAFGVIESLKLPEAITAVALVLYVAVNEILVKPRRLSPDPTKHEDQEYRDDQPQQQPSS